MEQKVSNLASVEKITLKNFKQDKTLLSKFVNYIYDYFYKFEKIKLQKNDIKKQVLKKITDKNNVYFAIRENKKTVGLVHLYLSKKYIDLCLIYIEKQYRGKGIGKQVINYLRRYFKKLSKKIKYFRIEIDSKNYYSQEFFKKLGAKEKSVIYLLKI